MREKKVVLMGFISLLLLQAALSTMYLLTVVHALGLPEKGLELIIDNPLNVTRVSEPFAVHIENLSLPNEAKPKSFRLTDAEGNEVPYQLENLTSYGYDAQIIFPVTVEAGSNATYYFYYSTEEGWSAPSYAVGVPITETDTNYTFAAETYSGLIDIRNGIMTMLKTNHSGNLLDPSQGFGSSSFAATGWEFAWFQKGINDSKTTLLAQGSVRSIIIAEGEVWYTDKKPYPSSSNWNYTTIYFLYKDRVEAVTNQVYMGTEAMQLMQARVGVVSPYPWLSEATATLDYIDGPSQKTIDYHWEWDPEPYIFDIYPKGIYQETGKIVGKFVDFTSANGSFGYGVIFYEAQELVRIQAEDTRPWGKTIELHSMGYNNWPSGPVQPGLELNYHCTLIPHEDANYTMTQTEARKAYYPLILYVKPISLKAFSWWIVGVTAILLGSFLVVIVTLALWMRRRSGVRTVRSDVHYG